MDPQFETKAEDGVYTLTCVAPKQLLLDPNFEGMVHNELLSRCYADGHIPNGPTWVETEDLNDQPQTSELREGESMTERMERWMQERGGDIVRSSMAGAIGVDLMRIRATVQILVTM